MNLFVLWDASSHIASDVITVSRRCIGSSKRVGRFHQTWTHQCSHPDRAVCIFHRLVVQNVHVFERMLKAVYMAAMIKKCFNIALSISQKYCDMVSARCCVPRQS